MPGVEELVLGPIIGILLQQLYEAIKVARTRTKKFDIHLSDLEKTVTAVDPKIKEIDRLNQKQDNYPKDEILVFKGQLEKGKALVSTCSEIPRWNKIKRRKYAKRLAELDASLRRLLSVEFQAEQLLDIKKVLSEMTEINKKLDRMNLQKPNLPGVATEGESSNPGPSSDQGRSTRPKFEINYRRKKINGEDRDFKISFGSTDR